MEPKILLELPDTALYQLLTVVEVKDVLRIREVFGDQRSGVFSFVESYFQTKYHLPDLRLVEIQQILSEETKDESLSRALLLGDYPEYALSVYEELDNPYLAVEEALAAGREESAIALMKINPDHLAFFFILALKHRRAKFLRYLLARMEFRALLTKAMREYMIEDEDIDWALATLKPEINEWLLTRILGGKVYTPSFFANLLALMTDEELLKAERVHGRAVATGNNPLGGDDYFHGREASNLFREERERRGL